MLIKGQYRILGVAPDGDSVRFYPDDPEWDRLDALAKKHGVRPNPTGGVQLRVDGIDALETHYAAGVKGAATRRQPARWGDAAAELLEFLGFDPRTVRRGDNERVSAAEPDEVPGFVASKFVDTYGRAVAFAFRGNTLEPDSDAFLEPELLESANAHLLTQGLAYPTFHAGPRPAGRLGRGREVSPAAKQGSLAGRSHASRVRRQRLRVRHQRHGRVA